MLQVPAALAAHSRFILYTTRPSARPGKVDKLPVDWRTGQVCDAHNPEAWASLANATAAAQLFGLGVGFVFTPDLGLWFLDIDEALGADGQWSPVAQQLCQVLAGCAVEVSQSGRGLHLFGSGALPQHGTRNADHHLELYHERRFVALTGTGLTGDAAHRPAPEVLQWLVSSYFPPKTKTEAEGPEDWRTEPVAEWSGPTDDDELIARLLRTPVSAAAAFAGRASFRDLWEANPEPLGRSFPDPARPYDASSADAALAAHLAWATGCNHERVLRLMRRSALARDKWERDDYLRGTVSYSVSRTSRVMQDRPAPSVAAPVAGVPQHGQVPAAVTSGTFQAAAAGAIPATLVNVQAALKSAESGVRIAYDAFKDAIVLTQGEEWRPFKDVDYVTLRTAFEQRGFKPVAGDCMRDAVLAVATANTIDTATQWAASLVWDGTPRVELAMSRYFGTADTPYSRAVGRYLFTALAGRALEPGCQADMAVILVGRQGVRKTTTVRNLAPWLEAFGEVNLEHLDDDTARLLRGKLVCELAELRGLKGRDSESIRAWITRRHEAWVPKYREFETTFPRRCVFIGTANGREILNDPEGNRRWLPIESGPLDPDAVARDRNQLWAEGVVMWRAGGIAWQEAQRLAVLEHGKFEEVDEWAEPVAAALLKPRPVMPGEAPSSEPFGASPFALNDLARLALGLDPVRMGRRDATRLGHVLRRLNYEKRDTWINGRNAKLWHRL